MKQHEAVDDRKNTARTGEPVGSGLTQPRSLYDHPDVPSIEALIKAIRARSTLVVIFNPALQPQLIPSRGA
jgi:hypothetical protein